MSDKSIELISQTTKYRLASEWSKTRSNGDRQQDRDSYYDYLQGLEKAEQYITPYVQELIENLKLAKQGLDEALHRERKFVELSYQRGFEDGKKVNTTNIEDARGSEFNF